MRFPDLVREYTTVEGTADVVLSGAVVGFNAFGSAAAALAAGDEFYYSILGIDNPTETEVGLGTWSVTGTIQRSALNGTLTDFTVGLKTVAVVTTSEWLEDVDTLLLLDENRLIYQTKANMVARAEPGNGDVFLVTEPTISGFFVFSNVDQSANVTADPGGLVYVPPTAAPTGASGAWVRLGVTTAKLRATDNSSGTILSVHNNGPLTVDAPVQFTFEQGYLVDGVTPLPVAGIRAKPSANTPATVEGRLYLQTCLYGTPGTLVDRLVVDGVQLIFGPVLDNAWDSSATGTRWRNVFGYTGDFTTQLKVGGVVAFNATRLQAAFFPALTGDVTTAGGALAATVVNVPISSTPAFSGGDVTKSAGSAVLTIGANKVTRGMLAASGAAAILGATAAGNISDLTPTVVTSMLDVFTTTAKGLVPAGTGGAGTYLDKNGGWTVPSGSGLSQAAGDARYLQLAGGNSVTGDQYITGTVNSSNSWQVKLASTANFVNTGPTSTVLTASATGVTALDGTNLVASDLILLKDQTLPAENGLYIVTTAGAVGVATVLTRVAQANTWALNAVNPLVRVQQGTANADSLWMGTVDPGGTLGTTAISYKRINVLEITDAEGWVGIDATKNLSARRLFSLAIEQPLTDGVTITPDFNTGFNFSVTLDGNRTLANPTNAKSGQSGLIFVKQGATGTRTLTYGTNWKFPGGAAANALSTVANSIDTLSYYVRADGTIATTLVKDLKS